MDQVYTNDKSNILLPLFPDFAVFLPLIMTALWSVNFVYPKQNTGPTDKKVIREKVGEGGTGVVYKATDVSANTIYALKQIPLDQVDRGIAVKAFQEMSSFDELKLKHENIVELHGVRHRDDGIWLVLEHVDMDLKKYIKTHRELFKDLDKRKEFFKGVLRQLLLGVSYCHSHKIVHGNLKPKKFLFDSKTSTLKIADFGLARALGTLRRKKNQAVWYRAPELLLGSDDYSPAVDIWSVGCILAYTLRGRPLFEGCNELQTLAKIFCLMGTPTDEAWKKRRDLPPYEPLSLVEWKPQDLKIVFRGRDPVGVDLLSRMLRMNPDERITAKDALAHPFFSNAG